MKQMRYMLSAMMLSGVGGLGLGVGGCVNVKVEPVEVKPIHITMDINLKIDRSLDEFFDYQAPPPPSRGTGGGAVVLPPATTMPARGGSAEPGGK